MAVIEAPRVQLKNGLCRTIEKTDLSADDGLAITHPSQRQEFHSRGSASAAAGVELKSPPISDERRFVRILDEVDAR